MPGGVLQDPYVLTVLRAAAVQAETVVHRVRSAIIVLAFLRLVIFAGDEMAAGVFKHWLTTGFLAFGLVASFLVYRQIVASENKEVWQAASALLDATLATAVILPSVIWPRETSFGLLRAPDVAIFPIVVAGAGLRLSTRSAMIGTVGGFVGLFGMAAWELQYSTIDLRYGLPECLLMGVVLVGAGATGYGLAWWVGKLVLSAARAARSAEQVRQQFGAYVPAQFATLGKEAILGGERVEVAVLFSDLRGFTSYSENLAPGALIEEVNAYFDAMVSVIHEHGGVVDKFIGDAIMVVYGHPDPEQAASRAVHTALAMQQAMVRHNLARGVRGLPPLGQGIGVHFGPAVAGNVGNAQRLQFTVLGDTVNVAARLEAATKEAGHSVLISAAALDAAKADGGVPEEIRALPPVQLRGRQRPTEVFGFL